MTLPFQKKCPCGKKFWSGGGIVRLMFEDGETQDVSICPECCKIAEESSKNNSQE